MENVLVLGDEAVALGGIDAGISGVYAYPGTPSTEITEFIQNSKEARQLNIRSQWSANEKTAYEAALGMSYAGRRSMVCMKHVGLNVAADAFMNSAITGVHGGLVVVVADDPGMHSSQNEQDSRFFARFAMIPVIEPANQQEAYEGVVHAFTLSEEIGLPVMVRLTTRISHSRSGIKRKAQVSQNILNPYSDGNKFILLPVNARKQYVSLLDKQLELVQASEKSGLNKSISGENTSLGVMAFGIAYNYVMEVRRQYKLNFPVFKVSQYPLPQVQIKQFFDTCKSVLMVEEGYPVYEELLRGYFNDNRKIKGKLDGTLPRTGELNPDYIAKALSVDRPTVKLTAENIAVRPPSLCAGCSHRDVYEVLNKALEGGKRHVFSDIGCYTLGALPPFNAISTCVDMGASVTMAKGAADAGLRPSVAVIGDSTFTHSGMTGLLDAVNDQSPITLIISDNSTTGMTGGQKSSGDGKYVAICKALGVAEEHICVLTPLKKYYEQNLEIMKRELKYEGVSVIIAQRECIQTLARRKKTEK